MTGRPLSELDLVDWASLADAYGSAEDVPEQLRAIAAGDDEAYDDAFGNLWHQGTIYSVTPHAIPFLIGILEAGTRNTDLLHLLGCMSRGEGESKVQVMAALVRGIPVFLPFLHSDDVEEMQLSAYLLGGLLEADSRVLPALLDGFHDQEEADGQLVFVYSLRKAKLDAATLKHLHGLMSREIDPEDDEARGLQLACALALAFNQYQPAFHGIAGVLKAALTDWDAEQFFSDALFDPDDIFKEITSAANSTGQAGEFAHLFWRKAQDSGDLTYAMYALDLTHPTPQTPLTPLARDILQRLLNERHGFGAWLFEIHGLPARPEALRKLLGDKA